MTDVPHTRIGVVGCGPRGIDHARSLNTMNGVELIGGCDLDAERRSTFEAKTGARSFDDLDALLNESPDVVAIATNVETHAALACKALEAGVHLVVEKPLAPSAAEARKIVALANKNGLHAAVSFQLHYHEQCMMMKELCSRIDPLLINHSRHSGLMQPQFLRAGKFTGVFDYLVHEIDLIRWWSQRPVVAVTARLGFGVYSDSGATDLAVLHLDLGGEDCAAATLVGSMAGPPLSRVIQIAGRHGAIQTNFGGEVLVNHGPGTEVQSIEIPKGPTDGTAALYRDLIMAIHGAPAPNMPTLQDGLATVTIVEAAFKSHEQGRRIDIPVEDR